MGRILRKRSAGRGVPRTDIVSASVGRRIATAVGGGVVMAG